MATSTLRFIIIVALVVGGVVLIDQAFPKAATGGQTVPGGGGPVLSPTPSPTTTPTKTPAPPQEPDLVGVNVAVFNGTSVSGLAGSTAEDLQKKYGMVPIQVTDAPSPVSVTTIYYRNPNSEDEATYLATKYFKSIDPKIARLEPGTDVDKDVEIAIYLGNDYATAQS